MIKKLLSLTAALLVSCTMFSQTQNVTFQVANHPANTAVYVFGSWSGWSNWQQPHAEADKIDKKSIHKRPRDWFCPESTGTPPRAREKMPNAPSDGHSNSTERFRSPDARKKRRHISNDRCLQSGFHLQLRGCIHPDSGSRCGEGTAVKPASKAVTA